MKNPLSKSNKKSGFPDGFSVYISADMEGVAGVVAPADVWEAGKEFEQARYWLTNEINAAIKASFDMGANEVVINDAHMYMRNIVLDNLDERACVVRGSRKPGYMMQGVELNNFTLAIFIGYHSMAGTQNGVLCHTFSDQWAGLSLNGKLVGEATYNAIYASEYNCPVGLVAGDLSLSEELLENIPWAEHVVVKEGIGRFAAKSLLPREACKRIYIGVKKSIEKASQNGLNLIKPTCPISAQINFIYPDRADRAIYIPGVERLSPVSVGFTSDNVSHLHKMITSILILTS